MDDTYLLYDVTYDFDVNCFFGARIDESKNILLIDFVVTKKLALNIYSTSLPLNFSNNNIKIKFIDHCFDIAVSEFIHKIKPH